MASLGIDIGGSGIKGALIDEITGKLLTDRLRIETPEHAKPADVAAVVDEVVRHFDWKKPVGCGFPAIVREGVAYSAANVDDSWIGTNVAELLSQKTGCEFHVLNDADAAGMAEMAFGVGKEYPKGVVMVITLGTGIGTAVFLDGRLLPNAELGHIELRGKDAEKRASAAVRTRHKLSWKKWAKQVQEYLSTIEMLLSPDLIIIGGGVSKNADKFLPYIKLRARIVPAKFRNEAGLIGAAIHAYRLTSSTPAKTKKPALR